MLEKDLIREKNGDHSNIGEETMSMSDLGNKK